MTDLSRIIAEEIHEKGPISMARFMELALYCPVCGYYERDADSVGKRGDFQTSVSVGSLFGELLASRFAGWLERFSPSATDALCMVEAGAHTGRLARDILGWFKRERPDLLPNLRYHLLEPSAIRRQWQQRMLQDCRELVEWSATFEDVRQATGGLRGIVFSNEFLDALPVHRFAWDARRRNWFEWLVGEEEGRFVWRRGAEAKQSHRATIDRSVPRAVQQVLPDEYVFEYSPARVEWWRAAADSLSQGWLVTFDYGFDDSAALTPERSNGTLRGYHRHQMTSDVLSFPGEQDITTHVHFGEVRAAGEACGLRTEFYGEQGRFLVQLIRSSTPSHSDGLPFSGEKIRQFKTLVHPDHFGYSFKVLVQSRLDQAPGLSQAGKP